MARGAIVNSHLIRLRDVPPPLYSIPFEGPDARRTPSGSMVDRLREIEQLSIRMRTIRNHLPTSFSITGRDPRPSLPESTGA